MINEETLCPAMRRNWLPRSLIRSVVVSICFILLATTRAIATTCVSPGWQVAIDEADVVFQGTVESRVVVPLIVNSTTFRVTRVWKGPSVQRYRIQLFPDVPLLFGLLSDYQTYREKEYVVFARYLPTGLWDGACSMTFPTRIEIDPELKGLLGEDRPPYPSVRTIIDIVPGWLVLVMLCIAGSIWPRTQTRRGEAFRSVAICGRRASRTGGAFGGALLAVALMALVNPTKPIMPTSFLDGAEELLIWLTAGLFGACYGALLGWILGPAGGILLSRIPTGQKVRISAIAGAGLGLLIGWSILGNLVVHVILPVSVVTVSLGSILSGRLLERSTTSSVSPLPARTSSQ